jgi:hypothetical protein
MERFYWGKVKFLPGFCPAFAPASSTSLSSTPRFYGVFWRTLIIKSRANETIAFASVVS